MRVVLPCRDGTLGAGSAAVQAREARPSALPRRVWGRRSSAVTTTTTTIAPEGRARLAASPASGWPTRRIALVVATLAAAAPLAALASERFLGFAPCALCLWQRWPYWAAVGIALAAAGLRSRALLGLAAAAVLVSGGIAALHVGVEQGWWPSPLPACAAATSAGAGGSVDDLLRSLAPRPNKPCDAPAYPVPGLPLSFAALNLLYALALGGAALHAAARTPTTTGRDARAA
uniref:Disulfide bond formation protein DsbB n=1 Tax=Nostoc flagelliforme str. Sunitezuoqi TaxID=676037 RepID=E7DQG3_9NOSO|nr:hypothetical protein Nfla_10002 [Nostoc flagelliforme str. Sunitezuoqi]